MNNIANRIYQLRKSGQIDQAAKLAEKALGDDPDSLVLKRTAAWVFYDKLKQAAELGKKGANDFIRYLEKIKQLNLPAEEKLLYDGIAKLLDNFMFNYRKEFNQTEDGFKDVNKIFDIIHDLPFNMNSKNYLYLFKAFHFFKNWPRYREMVDWWGFENFIKKNNQLDNNMRELIETAFIKYALDLLEDKNFSVDIARQFLEKLDYFIGYPEFDKLPYYKAVFLKRIENYGINPHLLYPIYTPYRELPPAKNDNYETGFFKNGEKKINPSFILWTYDKSSREKGVYLKPMYNNNNLFFTTMDGELFKANAQTGQILHTFKLPTKIISQIFMDNKHLLLFTEDINIWVHKKKDLSQVCNCDPKNEFDNYLHLISLLEKNKIDNPSIEFSIFKDTSLFIQLQVIYIHISISMIFLSNNCYLVKSFTILNICFILHTLMITFTLLKIKN